MPVLLCRLKTYADETSPADFLAQIYAPIAMSTYEYLWGHCLQEMIEEAVNCTLLQTQKVLGRKT
jgi:hypothetical protein